MYMNTFVLLCGLYNIGFAIFHLFFWYLFGWKKDLGKLTVANRAIMQILNIQLIYYFLFVAAICFLFTVELTTTGFGRFFLGGNALFWLIRTIQQFVFLRYRHYAIHILTIVFFLGMVLFVLPLIQS